MDGEPQNVAACHLLSPLLGGSANRLSAVAGRASAVRQLRWALRAPIASRLLVSFRESSKPCGVRSNVYLTFTELWPNDSASLRVLHQTGNLFIQISTLPAAALPPTAYCT